MILKKEFYFLRHGQTDHNISKKNLNTDHPDEISLNEMGKAQAQSIAPLLSSLPIQNICISPLKRVQETKEIVTSSFQATHYTIEALRECSAAIWKEMISHGMYAPLPTNGHMRTFIDRVRVGLNEALLYPGPTLIIAHGGIHWALCCLMGIQEHSWSIGNCVPVHFSFNQEKWIARKLEYTLESSLTR